MTRCVVAAAALGALLTGSAATASTTTASAAGATSHARGSAATVVHARLHLVHGHLPAPGVTGHTSPGPTNFAISSNWSGQIATGGTFTGVSADWTVPAVPDTTNLNNGDDWEYSATWIGIDGTSAQSLIQTGTAQQSTDGGPHYYAWYEALPGAEVPIDGTVVPGDVMLASVTETSLNLWRITVTDSTRAWTFTKQMNYTTPGASAEWVEEAPTVNGGVTILSDYGSATFTDMGVTGPGTASASYTPVFMADLNASDLISWPDTYTGAGSFTVHYGSPDPVITSVAPASGPTSGGTVVTVSGQYLFAASDVRFGFSAALGFHLNPNGTLTVGSPPGTGTVDIHLSSADAQSASVPADRFTYSPSAPAVSHGYWLVGSDGGIFAFGSAQFHGSTGNLVLQRPVTGITPTTDRDGYWLVATDGGVFAFGDAGFYGSIPGIGIAPAGSGALPALNAPIVGMVPSADSRGYFMVAADGGVFAFGDAQFEGSCPGRGGCTGSAVSVLPDATGRGYWLVTDTGNVYTFGDAPAEGQPLDDTDGQPLPSPVTSAVRTPDGGGYWVLLQDGQALTFGDAEYYQSSNGESTPAYAGNPATAVFATDDGLGYWIATANGTVADFGDAPDDGSMAGLPLNGQIIAATGW